MNAVTETVAAEPVSGVEIFVPLNKLKKSPRNARKVPHAEAAIKALAASIQHKGMIQNLVVEPEVKADGTPTGCYFVTAGEGRRLAMLLRAKRKQIRKSEPVRCWLDTANDPAEVSLDENATRTQMHPADQFERFHELSRDKGWGAEEIGARFGVSPEIVNRRLRLGAVSPKLMDVYRQDGLTLDQLAAFAITDDHEAAPVRDPRRDNARPSPSAAQGRTGTGSLRGPILTGLHRHALMSMMAYAFLQSRRLAQAGRKKKSRRPTSSTQPASRAPGHP